MESASELYTVNSFWDCIYINRIRWLYHPAFQNVSDESTPTNRKDDNYKWHNKIHTNFLNLEKQYK
jgi:hypothetical protein